MRRAVVVLVLVALPSLATAEQPPAPAEPTFRVGFLSRFLSNEKANCDDCQAASLVSIGAPISLVVAGRLGDVVELGLETWARTTDGYVAGAAYGFVDFTFARGDNLRWHATVVGGVYHTAFETAEVTSYDIGGGVGGKYFPTRATSIDFGFRGLYYSSHHGFVSEESSRVIEVYAGLSLWL